MYFVYIIRSIKNPKRIYTGFSKNIKKRIEEHNRGKAINTNKLKPWKLIYCSVFINKKTALDFEKYLKTSSGIAFKNKCLINIK